MTHCFTVAMMVSLLGKCCPHSPSFISLKTWKSEGAKSRLHSGCGRTVQSMCQCAPHSSKRYGARYYHVAKEKLSSSVDWLWKLEHSAEWASQWSSQSWGLSALQGIQKDHLLSYPKTQCMSLYHLRAVSWTSLSTGIDMLPLHWLPFSLQLVVMTPCLVISNDIIQKTVTFSLILVQYNRTNLRTVPFLFLCEHAWEPPSTNFVIFQHCHHCLQCSGADIQLCTQFPDCNLLIHTDELRWLFISWQLCMAIWSMASLPYHCCHCWNAPPTASQCINVQQASMNVNGCNFSCIEEFNDTPLLHTHFHVRRHSAWLSLCCHLSYSSNM